MVYGGQGTWSVELARPACCACLMLAQKGIWQHPELAPLLAWGLCWRGSSFFPIVTIPSTL